MSKQYFSHDCETRNDPDMVPLLNDFKAAGYGIYWSAVELLHQKGGFMPMNENTFSAIGKPIGAKSDLVGKVITKAVEVYNLFFLKDGNFYSNRVLRNLSMVKDLTQKKVNAGKASAAKRKQVLNSRSTPVQQALNTIQQIKLNETKVNTTTKVVVGTFFEMFRRVAGSHIQDEELLTEIARFQNRYPNIHPNQAGALVNTWVSNIGKQETKSEEKRMVY